MKETNSFKYRQLLSCKCLRMRKTSRFVTQFYDQKDNSNTNLTTNTDNTIKLIQKNSQIEIYFQPNDFNKYITWKQRILSVIPTNNILLKKCHKKNIITI